MRIIPAAIAALLLSSSFALAEDVVVEPDNAVKSEPEVVVEIPSEPSDNKSAVKEAKN